MSDITGKGDEPRGVNGDMRRGTASKKVAKIAKGAKIAKSRERRLTRHHTGSVVRSWVRPVLRGAALFLSVSGP